ncbi:hypothetical protein [Clostridium estertheticum]|uniref:hypothetical protein n=1 Tax=Clostridium estertheticum TaxID=238834 RepID=UPI001C0B93C9|nr:hypothetical protein [Clostridium estertheticum]MBU3173256.1 hypothetical protein [Clostridium estertheticum]
MLIPEKEEFLKEIDKTATINVETREELIRIYNHLKGYEKIVNINECLENVLREMFGKYTTDIMIPYQFHKSMIGTVIFSVMYGMKEVTYTVKDIIQLTKTDKNPKGYTKQYVGQEIRDGNLKGNVERGRHVFVKEDVNKYLVTKGLKTIQ